jgi:hypothetical protein
MSSNKFLRTFALLTILIVGLFVLLNAYVDIYGLFLGRKDRKVYTNERTSKYLLSYRYIPENYDGFIIGPSLSDNLNPIHIPDYKVYNASIMGANISELHWLIDKIVQEGHMKVAIFCLDPYLTKDYGPKVVTISGKDYYGALGSTNLLRTYAVYAMRQCGFSGFEAKEMSDGNGWTNFEIEMEKVDPKVAIQRELKQREYGDLYIDDRALGDLAHVLQELRDHNIKIVAYFSPVPRDIYLHASRNYKKFESRLASLFTTNDVLFNLNDDQYAQYTSDYNTYIDRGHLSVSGQDFVLREINSHLQGL